MNAFRLGAYVGLSAVAAVVTAIVTPTPDAIAMTALWLGLSALFCVAFEVLWASRGSSQPAPASAASTREGPPAPHPRDAFLSVRTCGMTDPGRVRTSNEDHFLVADLSRTLRVRQTSLPQAVSQHGRNHGYVLMVADGVGGHKAGEVASALTVETVEQFIVDLLRRFSNLQTTDESGVIRDLREAVHQADARIFEEARENLDLKGMGTTLTMAFFSGRRLFVLHAGDSRCYLLRGSKLERLTEDHTLVAALVSHGTISSEEAREHPYRHVVTNVLGGDKSGVRVDARRATVEPGDVLLLCSDGLTDMLDDSKISAILAAEADPEKTCRRLIDEANSAGGKDNVTVVVARFDAR